MRRQNVALVIFIMNKIYAFETFVRVLLNLF